MSCNSINLLSKGCGPITPGVKKLWMIAHKDLLSYSINNNIVDSIQFKNENRYVVIDFLKDTAGFDQNGQSDIRKGIVTSTLNLQFNLFDLSIENREFVKKLVFNPVSVILQINDKKYILGLDGGLKITGFSNTSGKAAKDEFGWKITLQETSYHFYSKRKNKIQVQQLSPTVSFIYVPPITSTTTTTTTVLPPTTTSTTTTTTTLPPGICWKTYQITDTLGQCYLCATAYNSNTYTYLSFYTDNCSGITASSPANLTFITTYFDGSTQSTSLSAGQATPVQIAVSSVVCPTGEPWCITNDSATFSYVVETSNTWPSCSCNITTTSTTTSTTTAPATTTSTTTSTTTAPATTTSTTTSTTTAPATTTSTTTTTTTLGPGLDVRGKFINGNDAQLDYYIYGAGSFSSIFTIGVIDSVTCIYYDTIYGLNSGDVVYFQTQFSCALALSTTNCPSSTTSCLETFTYSGPTTVYVTVDGGNCC